MLSKLYNRCSMQINQLGVADIGSAVAGPGLHMATGALFEGNFLHAKSNGQGKSVRS